jgi:hypothetical protein
MKDYGFNKWLNEYADFGLDMSKKPKEPTMANEDQPLHPLNVEYVVKQLKGKQLGEKFSIPNDFFGELQWGRNDGAIRLTFSPLGGVRAVLSKLTHNLEGDPTWICKKVIEVKHLFDQHPDKLTFKLAESIEKIDQEGIDAPLPGYKGLERLVIHMASELRRKTTQHIFIYEGIRVLNENQKYIIHFGVTGMGVQARGQKRVDKFCIQVEYSNKTGLIKVCGGDLGDVIDKHRWVYDQSEFIDYFSPAQPEEEIIEAILVNFNCY